MQYQKITLEEAIIEFHNNWLGEETVIVNGQMVSKKSSIWGTNHYFTILEEGHQIRYILTTKVDANMQVLLDLSRNGVPIQENIPVIFNTHPRLNQNRAKKDGLAKLNEYALEEALESFEEALKLNPKDPEIYFHMACAYSVLERTREGFEALRNAVANSLQNQEMILNHDMLAFLRMHPAFEGFLGNNFEDYNEELL